MLFNPFNKKTYLIKPVKYTMAVRFGSRGPGPIKEGGKFLSKGTSPKPLPPSSLKTPGSIEEKSKNYPKPITPKYSYNHNTYVKSTEPPISALNKPNVAWAIKKKQQEHVKSTETEKTKAIVVNQLKNSSDSGTSTHTSSTKGTLGYITYDSKEIHAFTKQQIFLKDYNIKRLNQLNQAFQSDGLSIYFHKLQMFLSEFRKIDEKDIGKLCLLQEKLQDFLVNDVQTNPAFRRSVSLVFTKRVDYESYSPQLNEFSDRFQIYLKKFEQRNDPFNENHFYDLNSIDHKKVIYYCMLRTYKEVIDSSIKVKLEYLSDGVKLKLDPDFVEIFKQL